MEFISSNYSSMKLLNHLKSNLAELFQNVGCCVDHTSKMATTAVHLMFLFANK